MVILKNPGPYNGENSIIILQGKVQGQRGQAQTNVQIKEGENLVQKVY